MQLHPSILLTVRQTYKNGKDQKVPNYTLTSNLDSNYTSTSSNNILGVLEAKNGAIITNEATLTTTLIDASKTQYAMHASEKV